MPPPPAPPASMLPSYDPLTIKLPYGLSGAVSYRAMVAHP
jgi:hypothetical protein